jgi:hypothetical protein
MYLSVEIDEPEDAKDYDDLLWLIAHRDVEIYMDDDRWYVMVQNPCLHFHNYEELERYIRNNNL